ncbi:rod shape-determining protein RodA [Blattabacterium cuenoti]|uniref:rod shape-determining protein RodA n=1 Tax=Blattabacterium cuenoti TaxID=1653831 RepID=UPI001EEA553A|nr:rod shape-determining protein RodA [Blattabacterium cuenoti]
MENNPLIKRNISLLFKNIDYIIVIFYTFIVFFGCINLYSVSQEKYEKQILWILFSFIFIFFIFLLKPIQYKKLSPFLFIYTLVLLISIFFFGKSINGSKSWYVLGPISFQPSEFAKITTSLMISYILNKHKVKQMRYIYIYVYIILIFPLILILMQPDPGSSIIFSSFILTLYRENFISISFIFYLLCFIFLFLISINISQWIVIPILFVIFFVFFLLKKKKNIYFKMCFYTFLFIIFSIFSITSPILFHNFLKKHHRDRINILFRDESNKKYRDNIGYNLLYSKTAIGSGKLIGKGFRRGTITKGRFVPEQHTDYIFCTVGEEWGFLGSTLLIIFYLLFISRIYFLSEKQNDSFGRIFGYSVGNIFLIHLIINLGMAMGIFPTIGIVLPFFSYGGSSLWSFTILIFLFLRLDLSNRINFV